MKNYYLLFIIILFSNCIEQDETQVNCNSDCTTIEGYFKTLNDEAISEIEIKLVYVSNNLFYNEYRNIKTVVTDENGFYKIDFYIKEEEIGSDANGAFRLYVDASSLNNETYIDISELETTGGIPIYNIERRDTIIEKSFYVPKKEIIKVYLNNYNPIDESDFYNVRTIFPGGLQNCENPFLQTENCTKGSQGFYSVNENSEFNLIAAKGEDCIVSVLKRKNAITTVQDTIIHLSDQNNEIELSFEY